MYAATEERKAQLAIKQPPYRPSPDVFPPVWAALYGLTGYAAYRAVHYGTSPFSAPSVIRATRHGATLYTIQLGLNLAWMPLFFTLGRPIEATVDIALLLGINGYLAYLWGSVDRVAGWCFVPYLGWLGFATYLSAGAGYLNGWSFADKRALQDEKKDE